VRVEREMRGASGAVVRVLHSGEGPQLEEELQLEERQGQWHE